MFGCWEEIWAECCLHCWRPYDLEYLGFLFFLNLKYLCLLHDCLWGIIKEKNLRTTSVWNMEKYFGIYGYFIPYFWEISRYVLPAKATQDAKSVQSFVFLKKNIRCYLVIWSQFAGKGGISQSGSKIVDLGFVKFKSNGTKANRPLKQIQKTQGGRKKSNFFLFSLGVLHGFSWKSNEDELSQK